MKTVRGAMLVKEGKGWGKAENGGHGYSSSYGWVGLEDADIHDPDYCTKPSDLTYRRDPKLDEMNTGKIVLVEKVVTVSFTDEDK